MTRESIVKYFRRCGYSTVKHAGRMTYEPQTTFSVPLLSGDILVHVLNSNIELAIDAPSWCRLIGIHTVKNGKELMEKINQNIRMGRRISAKERHYSALGLEPDEYYLH